MKGKGLTSEEITAKRRAERKQFKLDRAKAIAAAAAEAETAFKEQGRIIAPGIAPDGTRIIPSAATWKPTFASAPRNSHLQTLHQTTRKRSSPYKTSNISNSRSPALTSRGFSLVWALDCLTILHPETMHHPSPPRFDNHFLVSYIAYHHYRSLGWVVKSGIKFCVDYLLYKRGPVFQHAEFAIVVIPVYEDPQDQATSPFNL